MRMLRMANNSKGLILSSSVYGGVELMSAELVVLNSVLAFSRFSSVSSVMNLVDSRLVQNSSMIVNDGNVTLERVQVVLGTLAPNVAGMLSVDVHHV